MIAATVIGPVAFPTQLIQQNQPPADERPESVSGSQTPGNAGMESRNRAAEAASAGKVSEGDDASRAKGETLAQHLTAEELEHLEQLKQTDRAVRQHELAHQIAGGQYTGGASYEYEIGPDGRRYAVAGEVPIDYGPVAGDPEATIDKMQTVIAAALAPMDPSPKDHQVAAKARQYLAQAQTELAMQRMEQYRSPETSSETNQPARSNPAQPYEAIAAGSAQPTYTGLA